MATKSYYVSRPGGFVRRLDNLTLPWIDISAAGAGAGDSFLDIMAVPGQPDRVIAIGRSRQIYWSNDAGVTWTQAVGTYTTLPSDIELQEIWIVNNTVSYVVGPQGWSWSGVFTFITGMIGSYGYIDLGRNLKKNDLIFIWGVFALVLGLVGGTVGGMIIILAGIILLIGYFID